MSSCRYSCPLFYLYHIVVAGMQPRWRTLPCRAAVAVGKLAAGPKTAWLTPRAGSRDGVECVEVSSSAGDLTIVCLCLAGAPPSAMSAAVRCVVR